MSLFENVSGEFLFHYRNLLLLLSNMSVSPMNFVKELVENAYPDAGASHIWVVREPGKLVVIDDGHGMVPRILDDDILRLMEYWDDILEKRVDPEFDIRKSITLESRKSLEWAAYNVGFSGKLQTTGSRVRGLRGIGIQGFRQYAQEAEWRTRPEKELALEYYGEEDSRAVSPPAYSMRPPTKQELLANNIEPVLVELTGPFEGFSGEVLEHGTVVEVSGILPEVENVFQVKSLIDFLQTKFGGDIRAGLKIYVVDRVSLEGRTTPAGIVHEVPPSSYSGSLIFDRELRLRGAHPVLFRSVFYYDPTGRNLSPSYRRFGADRNPLTSLEELQHRPWLSGKLSGYSDYPELPEAIAGWDTGKEVPLHGPIRNQWAKALIAVEDEIEEGIERVEEELRRARQDTATNNVVMALREAMSDLDKFRGVSYGGGVEKERKRQTARKPAREKESPEPETRVMVTVKDAETSQPVRGVVIELWRMPTARRNLPPELVMQRETGKSGEISFGHVYKSFGEGKYQLRMVIPVGMHPADEIKEHNFNLSINQQGVRFLFRVLSGQQPVEGRPIGRFTIHYVDFLPDAELYSIERLGTAGVILINKLHPDYKRAYESGDQELTDTLVTIYVSAAITEYGLKAETADVQLNQSALLAGHAISAIRPRKRR